MEESAVKLTLSDWSIMDQPREKWLRLGGKNLSLVELLTIMIGSGTSRRSAYEIAQRILKDYEGDLWTITRMTIKDWMKYEGIGKVKAITICTAMEWGRRISQDSERPQRLINSPQALYKLIRGKIEDLKYEEFWLICLDRGLRLLHCECLFKGGMAAVVVDVKLIFMKALEYSSHSIMIAHNHPSGRSLPSQADKEITRKIKEAGLLLEIQLEDHLIVGYKSYYSFREEEKL